jgi:hypothetical protein
MFIDGIQVDQKTKLEKYEQWKSRKKEKFVDKPKRWSKWLFLNVKFLIHCLLKMKRAKTKIDGGGSRKMFHLLFKTDNDVFDFASDFVIEASN